ncbi:hypothetical protein SKAU_G00380290 [Synaphobranchus kaupii]|uniref:Uncharacterized protein n=1 Tax=Synaphobranchus kaupii TaxID=118154 RepID=A0A9Q1IEM0_SYNKA|nr:hypothetical protein SKAU_G00380290 [Synaphobranchus kaupii]
MRKVMKRSTPPCPGRPVLRCGSPGGVNSPLRSPLMPPPPLPRPHRADPPLHPADTPSQLHRSPPQSSAPGQSQSSPPSPARGSYEYSETRQSITRLSQEMSSLSQQVSQLSKELQEITRLLRPLLLGSQPIISAMTPTLTPPSSSTSAPNGPHLSRLGRHSRGLLLAPPPSQDTPPSSRLPLLRPSVAQRLPGTRPTPGGPHLELEMDEWGVQTEHISFIDEEDPPL